MKTAIALVMLTAVARAAPITPPTGWTLDPSLATPPVVQRFGGATTKVDVYAYRAPQPGAVLYVNRAEATVPETERDRLATIELDEPRAALRRQADAKAEQDMQRFDAATKQLEAAVTWRDSGVIDISRVVIAAEASRIVAVTGQCVLAIDVPPDVIKACDAALATLETEVPAAKRVTLAIVQPEPPPKPVPAVLDDGGKQTLPAIRLDPPEPEQDRRPIYVGGGLVVLAALFYWNKRRREKFEAEHPLEAPPEKRDADADDLHSAAEDDK